MCQFYRCQSSEQSNHGLFQPLSPAAASAVRAGWWAYHLDRGTYAAVGDPYGPPGQTAFSYPVNSPTIRDAPSYDYGYGTDF
ncbi:MAG: hypothetical protein AAGI45_22815 [Cyanobacteria bacterium P01_H01_bin.26]